MRLRNCLGMIWSVSTFTRSSGATIPVCLLNGCMAAHPTFECLLNGGRRLIPRSNIHKVAGNGCGGGHLRADEVGAPALALTSLKIAVRGRGAALAGLEDVRVHAQAHRAARLAPVE